jgi:hypothetical protein
MPIRVTRACGEARCPRSPLYPTGRPARRAPRTQVVPRDDAVSCAGSRTAPALRQRFRLHGCHSRRVRAVFVAFAFAWSRRHGEATSRGHDEHALKDISAAKLGEGLFRGHDEHVLKDISAAKLVRLNLADATNLS